MYVWFLEVFKVQKIGTLVQNELSGWTYSLELLQETIQLHHTRPLFVHICLAWFRLPTQTIATPTPNFCILAFCKGSIDPIFGKIKIIVLISQINTFIQFSSNWSTKLILPNAVQQKISCLHLREYHAFQFKINPPNFLSQLEMLTSPLLDSAVTHY